MSVWSRKQSGRLVRVFQNNLNMEDNSNNQDDNNNNNNQEHDQLRTLRHHMNPIRTSAPSCLVFPPDASNFNFKPQIIQLLPNFHGLDSENSYLHLREFEEVCNTYNDQICSMDTVRLKLFPFSLKDKAKTWLQNLRSTSIRSWEEMQQQFLKKIFLSHRTNSFKRQITTFSKKQGETFYQCWDRYKELLNTCPHHGFEIWRIVSNFYEGLIPKDRQMIEFMCNGTFEDKNPNEAMEYLESLAENAQNWDNIGTIEPPTTKINNSTNGGGIYNLKDDIDIQAKLASLARKIESLEMKKSGQLKSIQEMVCHICDTHDHSTKDCPTLPSFKECLHEQANYVNNYNKPKLDPFSQTYNPGWRNHPNFSWRNDNNAQPSQQPFQNNQGYVPYIPPPRKNFEDEIHAFVQKQESINIHNVQSFNNLKETLEKFASALNIHEKGKFSSQPQPNPKNQELNNKIDQIKSVIALRSGRIVNDPYSNEKNDHQNLKSKDVDPDTFENDDTLNSNNKNENDKSFKNELNKPLPFPHALKNHRKQKNDSDIYEVFKQVKINIPLIDAIKQVPSYAKFLKDLCTVKRKWHVKKKAFLAEQVSSIIQNNSSLKYKDPGCPKISCVIGENKIKKSLLDLGASVNLLPYSVNEKLNLGELKPTSVTLLLADRSIKIPRGILEDLLVQVDKFIYHVDFIVLDTQPIEVHNEIPIILGRPFLATSNALINCRNGIMKLSFGNMTLELNVFNLCKQPSLNEDGEDNIIESIVEDNIQEENLNQQSEVCLMESLESKNNDDNSKLELKALPVELKYAFLGENKTYPVVISSNLLSNQEKDLIELLKKHKKAFGWTLEDIKGINPLIFTHRIYLEENSKTYQQTQRRLNPHMKEVVKKEVLKLLDAGIIYPISDSNWVSPTQVVPKKSQALLL